MDLKTINKRLVSGFASLTFGQFFIQGLSYIVSYIFLARFLPVDVLGIFNIANTILSFFTFFSDIGLAAALIQKKDISDDDLKTTFFIQQVLVLLIVILVMVLSPWLASIYKLDDSGIWLIRALAIGFMLTSFKVIPSVLLERELKFTPQVIVNILEAVSFNVVLVILVLMNYSINAFTIAVLVRSIIGVVSLYLIAPWKIKIGFSKISIKRLLNFGAPFQLNTTLALLKDRLVPLVYAPMVGHLGVGYLTWAQGITNVPIMLLGNMIRVTFPAFSRLQDEKEKLREIINQSLFLTTLFSFPILFGIMAIAPDLIQHVVKSKWLPALPLIYLFSLNVFWATLSSTFTNILMAVGKIKITLILMVMWTILTWALTPLFAYKFGFIGVGISQALISITSIVPIIITKKIVEMDIIKSIWKTTTASLLMGFLTYLMARFFVVNFLTLMVVILIGALIFGILIYLLAEKELKQYIHLFKKSV